MKRITILKRRYQELPNSYVTDREVIRDMTDKKIESRLQVNNKLMRVNFWVIEQDFKLNLKSGQCGFFKFCIEQYFNPYPPYELKQFCELGKVMVTGIDPDSISHTC